MPTLAIDRYLQEYMIFMLAASPTKIGHGLAKKWKFVSKRFLFETSLVRESHLLFCFVSLITMR